MDPASKQELRPHVNRNVAINPDIDTGGAPTIYSEALTDEICLLLVEGQTLSEICSKPEFPHKSTVLKWLHKHEDFYKKYFLAKQLRVEAMAEEILEIADDTTDDTYTVTSRSGREYTKVNYENIARSRVRIETRRWLMEKLFNKVYGARVQLDHQGGVSAQLIIRDGNEPPMKIIDAADDSTKPES